MKCDKKTTIYSTFVRSTGQMQTTSCNQPLSQTYSFIFLCMISKLFLSRSKEMGLSVYVRWSARYVMPVSC